MNEKITIISIFVYDCVFITDDTVSQLWGIFRVKNGRLRELHEGELETIHLSAEAREGLRKILIKETGGLASHFTNTELNEIGGLVLTALAERLKMEL